MKDGILNSTIDGISDGSKDRNSGGITDFASPHVIPEVSIEEHVVKSFWSTLKEVCDRWIDGIVDGTKDGEGKDVGKLDDDAVGSTSWELIMG